MTTHPSLKRLALVGSVMGALVGSALLSVAPQAVADTGTIDHSCTIDSDSVTLPINLKTNAPASIATGQSIQPTLTADVTIPSTFVDQVRSQGGPFGVTKLGGTAKASITTNGSSTPVTVTLPNQNIPASAGTAMTFTGSHLMAKVTPNVPGTITYAPGTVTVTLNFVKSDNSTLATKIANCAKPGSAPAVDTVSVTGSAIVKAPSRIGTGVQWKKATKKLTVAAKVIATPNQVVTGNVNFSLYKAGKRIRSVFAPLSASAAKRTFSGKIGKGTYYVKFTYYGSSKVKASTFTRKVVLK